MPSSAPNTPRRKYHSASNPLLAPFSSSDSSRIVKREDYGTDHTPSPPPTTAQGAYDPNLASPGEVDAKLYCYDTDSEDGSSPTKKRKGTNAAAKGPKAGATKTPGVGRGRGRGLAWTEEEDWVLFQLLHPKTLPSWAGIAAQVGRDVKSCQNRYTVMSKRLERAIKSIGST